MVHDKNGNFRSRIEGAPPKYRITDHRKKDMIPGLPEDRTGLVWPLTREIASLSKKYNAERRQQRNITNLVRREG
jgi:hypothetical protein